MENHRLLTDEAFLKAFQKCTLAPADFSHEAHLRLAYVLINDLGPFQAEKMLVKLLKDYVAHVDAADKFNYTLTLAGTKVVSHFMQRSSGNNFQEMLEEFPQLKHNFKGLMACHYSIDIFDSTQAKYGYLEPDFLPFDL